MEQDTTAAAYLPDELIVEILTGLPAKSLCRFKCVSRRWRRIISDPAHRDRLAQTLSGFFYESDYPAWRFTALPSPVTPLNLAGDDALPVVDTALSFLPRRYEEMKIPGSCNGLLLLLCSKDKLSRSAPPFYVVCNPATREWMALPQPKHTPGNIPEYCNECNATVRTWYATVGFDPAISSHFYVFQVVEVDYMNEVYLKAVEIYSSETGTWDLRGSDYLDFLGRITYFNGFLHLPITSNVVASVDAKGQPWRVAQVRCDDHCHYQGRGYVGHSQGCLLYVHNARKNDVLSIYVLEDQENEEWTLKHNVSKPDLLLEPWKHPVKPTYYIAGFHPHGDSVFFYDRSRERLISYDMKRGDWHIVCVLEDFKHAHHPFFPYVLWYSRGLGSPNIN